MRARVLLAEAAALGVTIEDLVAESSVSPKSLSRAPTVRQYGEIVSPTFSKGTAGTYWWYWRLAIDQLGERTMDSIGVDDCESIVTAAEKRARHNRLGSDGRSARENCIGALHAPFSRAERAVAAPPTQSTSGSRRRRAARSCRCGAHHQSGSRFNLLLIRFHLESGARREGALNLRMRDLDQRRSSVWLRVMPASPWRRRSPLRTASRSAPPSSSFERTLGSKTGRSGTVWKFSRRRLSKVVRP
jgi:integrase/recombinase XerC